MTKITSITHVPSRMKPTLSNLCSHWKIARVQRRTENDAGLGDEGTMGFEEMGCYVCHGRKFKCASYTSPLSLYNMEKRLK